MHNMISPGKFIKENILDALNISTLELSEKLDISLEKLISLLQDQIEIDHDIAIKLGYVTNTTPESWINQQKLYNEWKGKKIIKTIVVYHALGILPFLRFFIVNKDISHLNRIYIDFNEKIDEDDFYKKELYEIMNEKFEMLEDFPIKALDEKTTVIVCGTISN